MSRLLRQIPALLALIAVLAACGGTPAAQPTAAPAAPAEQPTAAPAAPDAEATAAPAEEPTAVPAPPAADGTPVRGGEITIGLNADMISFNGNLLSFVNYPVLRQCYNRLVKFDHAMQSQPELATEWTWSDDYLKLTLKLREGVKFHNGREFVADDVVKNFEFAAQAETGGNVFPRLGSVESVVAIDDHTVEINLSQVTPNFIDTIDMLSIMAPESFETVNQGCIGTGPFKFVERIPGDQIVFERNPDYWKEGLPYLDKITFKPFADAEALSTALETGTIDGGIALPYRDYERLKESANIFFGYAGSLLYVLVLNPPDSGMPDHPLSNKLVRQAIHYALDRQTIIDQALYGVGEATVLPFPTTSIAYFEDLKDAYEYNLDKARELLAEAGYADGFDLEIIATTGYPELVDASQILKNDLDQIGIRTTVTPMENATWTPTLLSGQYQATMTFIGRSHKDPSGLFDNSPFRISNSPIWPDGDFPEGYKENLEKALSTADVATRTEAYRVVQEAMLDESVQIPMSWRFTLFGAVNELKGMSYTVDDEVEFEQAWIER